MDTGHNHPPACCCQGEFTDCPLCPEHGELAQLANAECSSCHQLSGRPPTDYCQIPAWHAARHVPFRTPGYDGPEGTEWPRHTPSTEHVWGKDTHYPPQGSDLRPHHIRACPDLDCPPRPTPLTEHTPGSCPSCHRDYNQAPTQTCTTPQIHDNPSLI